MTVESHKRTNSFNCAERPLYWKRPRQQTSCFVKRNKKTSKCDSSSGNVPNIIISYCVPFLIVLDAKKPKP